MGLINSFTPDDDWNGCGFGFVERRRAFTRIEPGGKRFESLEQLVESAKGRYRSAKKTYEKYESSSNSVYCFGTLHGELLDGTPYSGIRFIDRFTVRDGRLVDQMVWNDMAEVLGPKLKAL